MCASYLCIVNNNVDENHDENENKNYIYLFIMNVRNLLSRAIEWMMAALQQVRNTRSVSINADAREASVATMKPLDFQRSATLPPFDDDLLRVKDETVSSHPLPLRVLPLTQGENSSSTKSEESLLIRIEEFIDEHYHVRYNMLSQQYEVAPRDTEHWMPVSSMQCNRLVMELNRAGIILAKPYIVKTVIEGGTLAEEYHPVRSYLTTLPEWDGVERIEALFRRVTDDEQLLRWLRKWFIAMVAQAMGRMGTYGNSVCPILISCVQGWGKSQFAKLLVPPQISGFFTDTFNLQQEDGCLRRMTAYMLINVDEIDRFGERRMATFKNMIQLAVVSMKRAYHTQMEQKERMASFIATSNCRHLLNDESGSRRFICVELTHAIDVNTSVNHAQLYAEALAALNNDERCWFSEEETRQLEKHNAPFAVNQGVWALMKRSLTLCEIPEGAEERLATLHSATEVYDYLHHQSPATMASIERSTFGYFLTEFGAQQVRVRNKRVYGVSLG